VAELGVGPRPIPQRRLDAIKLGVAIRMALTDPQMQRRAADLGARIRGEDGTANAAVLIEQAVAERQ
jgi:UDP:flavonoid glycosyltransferase YjiC (YdhE family)